MGALQDNIKIMLYFGSEINQVEKWIFYERYSETFRTIRKEYYSKHYPMIDLSSLKHSNRIDRFEGFRLISAEERIYGLKCIMKLDNDKSVQDEIKLSIKTEKEREQEWEIDHITTEKRVQYLAYQNIDFLVPLLNKHGQERGYSEAWFLQHDFKGSLTGVNISEKLQELVEAGVLIQDHFADQAHQFINDVTGKYEKYGQKRYRLNLSYINHPYQLDNKGKPVLIYSDGVYYPKRVIN